MRFHIDKQSLDELNLLGRFRQGSVYFLFNQVKTRGGEQLLDKYFKSVLTDEQAINQRTAIFRFFEQAAIRFPFDAAQLVQMQEYIDAGGSSSRWYALANVMIKRTLSSLTRDERYKSMIQGLQATIVTLKKCLTTVELLCQLEGPYKQRVTEIRSILQQEELAALIDTDIYAGIKLSTVAGYDYLLKTKLNNELRQLLDFIAELDVYITVAQIAATNHFNYAVALPKQANVLRAANLKHPCIQNAVGNDIEMPPQSNVVFLTGANMAGKSTWMKSIGISMYLAHIGFPVAADSMEFSLREGIFSSINVADNIGLGYSHFYAEVVRVKTAADATCTGSHLLLMFDELFKGTNVKDAYDGTLAVTRAFAEYENCLFIVSTHIIEVGEALHDKENIQFRYMPTVLEGNIPRYTYQLKQGITEDRQGMMIIKNEGILELISTQS
ncbi:MutS-related protein [Pseudobacter ginsenosidimutans]|uniref:MutS-like protein n=1 Tax=Pseudobacter ginsenosidimutans TaxID=661488 RepID=A0A4Q7N0C5_9BACT|nr:DNA mismatch repair protein [Pseudobacter ginsenosidimutans]QEC43629.1 DNA mismatch repair protein [Pseudobacter ginsenosidimutans]RZS75027.1 MutS-like protein [Pseudobacter ginsenosidimutans]